MIILLDLNMPVKNGFEVLAALAHDAQLKCIPTIVLTTSTRPEDITRCYELGANGMVLDHTHVLNDSYASCMA